tara:strand:- start:51 stop:941 length:891 start_codon:yes stop_codon:yes gene_type:complete
MKLSRINLYNTWSKNYSIQKIPFKDNKKELTLYLKKQSLIKYELIKNNFSINYNSVFPIGYILKDKSKIVGFLGTLFSYRLIKKKNILFCNIHSWLVETKHRVASQLLFKNILNNCVITVLTARPGLTKVFKKMGFRRFFLKYRVSFLLNTNFFHYTQNTLKVISDKDFVLKKLNNENKNIFNKHKNKIFYKFIIQNKKNEYSFFICKYIKKKKYLKIVNIMYSSNTSFVKKNWSSIQIILLKKFKVLFCGNYFLNNNAVLIPKKNIFTKDFTREIFIKNLPKSYKFNSLFSEHDF